MSNAIGTGKRYFELSDQQRVDWLRLFRSQNVGPKTFRDLISHFGSAASALEALPDIAKRGGAASRIRVCSESDAEREIANADQFGATYLAIGEPDYPNTLRQIESSPPIFCYKGNSQVFNKPSLSIVGSRNASIAGLKMTDKFASEIGSKDYVITSGLARGIDTQAHKSSLNTGTIAVFAGSIASVYPEENMGLAKQITELGGAILSDMPFGHKPTAKDFPRRNRIVAAISQGVLIVEAAKRSGSLITARIANEFGRIVLAVPGSPLDPRSAGTNSLIREGATLVTSSEEIIETLAPMYPAQQEFKYDLKETDNHDEGTSPFQSPDFIEPDNNVRQAIIAAIGHSPIEIDDIARFSDATLGEIHLVLLELSLAGRLERHAGNRVSLI